MVDLFDVEYKFIFDHQRTPGERKYGLPIFSFNPFPDEELHWISSVGETRHKRALIQEAMNLPVREAPRLEEFINLIHPTALTAKTAELGFGIFMQPFSVVYARAKIEDHVLLCGACNVGHHSVVGAFSTLGHQVFLGGHVTIEDGVFLGSGCKIKPGKTIGEGAVIGMGAVVTKDVPANEIWIGNPAKPLLDHNWPPPSSRGMYLKSDRPKKLLEPWR